MQRAGFGPKKSVMETKAMRKASLDASTYEMVRINNGVDDSNNTYLNILPVCTARLTILSIDVTRRKKKGKQCQST